MISRQTHQNGPCNFGTGTLCSRRRSHTKCRTVVNTLPSSYGKAVQIQSYDFLQSLDFSRVLGLLGEDLSILMTSVLHFTFQRLNVLAPFCQHKESSASKSRAQARCSSRASVEHTARTQTLGKCHTVEWSSPVFPTLPLRDRCPEYYLREPASYARVAVRIGSRDRCEANVTLDYDELIKFSYNVTVESSIPGAGKYGLSRGSSLYCSGPIYGSLSAR